MEEGRLCAILAGQLTSRALTLLSGDKGRAGALKEKPMPLTGKVRSASPHLHGRCKADEDSQAGHVEHARGQHNCGTPCAGSQAGLVWQCIRGLCTSAGQPSLDAAQLCGTLRCMHGLSRKRRGLRPRAHPR